MSESLPINTLVSRYRILSHLGAGGMGEVYLAQDTQLDRKAALKFLAPAFTQSPDHVRRFVQEAKAASALNHPNILTIYEIGQVAEGHYIAAEFIEGETLRGRLARNRMPVPEVLNVGIQIAGALAAAHAAGIVHRDIKPENIMLRPDGYAKVLDFGLAKLTETRSPSAQTEAPTVVRVDTEPGAVMGTARYMSPEQARGLAVDERSDIFSLGAVLYEMSTGRGPFGGPTNTDVLVAILQTEPLPLQRYSSGAPAELNRLVIKALAKDREERYQTVKDLLIDLKNLKKELDRSATSEWSSSSQIVDPGVRDFSVSAAGTRGEGEISATSKLVGAAPSLDPNRGLKLAAGILLGVVVVAIVTFVYFALSHKEIARDSTVVTTDTSLLQRATQITTWSGLDIFPALSPDGNTIAFSSDRSGNFELYVRQLTAGGREIQLTSDGQQNLESAWSPDGQRIAFSSKNRGGIWVVPALGGTGRMVTEFGSHPAWSPDSALLAFQSDPLTDLGPTAFGAMPPSTLWIVSSQGGSPKQITQPGKPAGGHGSPSWSPDGKRIVFVSSDIGVSEISTISPDGTGLKGMVIPDQRIFNPIFAADGQSILYPGSSGRSNWGLWKIRIQPGSGEAAGPATEIRDTGSVLYKHLTISANGKKLACSALAMANNLWTVPISSTSSESTGTPAPLTQDTTYRKSTPEFSPEGQRIAYGVSRVGSPREIWVMDANGKNAMQLMAETRGVTVLGWFPKGDQLAFLTTREGKSSLRSISVENGRETQVAEIKLPIGIAALSPDGKQIAFNSNAGGTINVWTISVEGGQAKQLTFDKELMGFPSWSPDGKLLALEVKRGDDTHVAIIPSNGGAITQLTSDRGQSWSHSWSPDGDKITFAGSRDGYWNIWWVSRTSKTQKQVTNNRKLNAYLRYPAWSPKGDQIVYEYAETTGNIWLMDIK